MRRFCVCFAFAFVAVVVVVVVVVGGEAIDTANAFCCLLNCRRGYLMIAKPQMYRLRWDFYM